MLICNPPRPYHLRMALQILILLKMVTYYSYNFSANSSFAISLPSPISFRFVTQFLSCFLLLPLQFPYCLLAEIQAGAQAAEAQVEVKSLRVENNRLKEEAARLREDRQTKEKELTDAKLELATLRRTSDVAIESLKAGILPPPPFPRVKSLSFLYSCYRLTLREITQLKSEKATLEKEVLALKSSQAVSEGEAQAKEKMNDSLKAENEKLKERIKELEEQIRKLEEELRSLRDAQEENVKQKQELLEKNKALSTELHDLGDIQPRNFIYVLFLSFRLSLLFLLFFPFISFSSIFLRFHERKCQAHPRHCA